MDIQDAKKGIYVVGIDPGIRGAVALVEFKETCDGYKAVWASIRDMPILRTNGRNRVGVFSLLRWFESWPEAMVVIEEPPISVYSTRKGGEAKERIKVTSATTTRVSLVNYGRILAAIEQTYGHDWHSVVPSAWKGKMLVTKQKGESLEMARVLFPMVADQLTRKADDGRAEALLLAQYGASHLFNAPIMG